MLVLGFLAAGAQEAKGCGLAPDWCTCNLVAAQPVQPRDSVSDSEQNANDSKLRERLARTTEHARRGALLTSVKRPARLSQFGFTALPLHAIISKCPNSLQSRFTSVDSVATSGAESVLRLHRLLL